MNGFNDENIPPGLKKVLSTGSGIPTPAFLQSDNPTSSDLMMGAMDMLNLDRQLSYPQLSPEAKKKQQEDEQTIRETEKHLETNFDAGLVLIGNKATVDGDLQKFNETTVDGFVDRVMSYVRSGDIAFRASDVEWTEATVKQANLPVGSRTSEESNILVASAATEFFTENIRHRAQTIADEARKKGRQYLMPDEIASVIGFITMESVPDGQFAPQLMTYKKGATQGFLEYQKVVQSKIDGKSE